MKTIASLKGPEFLRACNRTRHAVSDFIEETGVMELRKIMPKIPENATADEKAKLFEEQGKKNINAILDRLLEEYPDATYKVLCTLAIPEDGEELDGFDLLGAALELVGSDKTLDFFGRLVKSDLLTMVD